MLLSLVKYISGYLRVQVTGYAPERFLNLCGNHNIVIWNLIRIEGGYEFFISLKAFRELKPFLKKTKTMVRITQRCGFPFWLFRYRKRKLFFGGICVFFAFLFLLSRFIWNIEIVGNTSVTDETMLSYLTENGYGFGTKKSEIDCTKLEEKIRLDYPEIIWTSAQISGTKLTIQIKENLVTGEEAADKEDGPKDIIADKEAVIARIVTRAGVPQIVAGDEVKKGDPLVVGRIDIVDDNGETIDYNYTISDADIYGYTSYTYSDTFPLTYQKKQNTGNETKRYGIEFGEKLFMIPWKSVGYERSDKATDYLQLNLFSDFYLPVTFCVDTYSEYEMKTCKYTEEEAKKEANAHFLSYLKKFDEKNVQILEKNVIIDVNEKNCSVSGTVKTCEKIGVYADTEVISRPADERPDTDELE